MLVAWIYFSVANWILLQAGHISLAVKQNSCSHSREKLDRAEPMFARVRARPRVEVSGVELNQRPKDFSSHHDYNGHCAFCSAHSTSPQVAKHHCDLHGIYNQSSLRCPSVFQTIVGKELGMRHDNFIVPYCENVLFCAAAQQNAMNDQKNADASIHQRAMPSSVP